MNIRFFVPWIVLAAVLGFALGGSAVYVPVSPLDKGEAHATAEHSGDKKHPNPFTVEWFTADPVASATFLLVFVTGALAVVTGFLYFATRELAKDAASTAKSEFAATHRPHMRVRYFKHLDTRVRLTMVNTGDTAGYSYGCRAIVEWLNPRDLPPFIDLAMGYHSTGRKFAVGEWEEVDIPMPKLQLPPIPDEACNWVVYGIIDYKSEDGARHWQTAFCRYWDNKRGRFEPIADPDYNHED